MILVLLRGHILLEVDTQHLFEILLTGAADGEAVVLDALFDAGKVSPSIAEKTSMEYFALHHVSTLIYMLPESS